MILMLDNLSQVMVLISAFLGSTRALSFPWWLWPSFFDW